MKNTKSGPAARGPQAISTLVALSWVALTGCPNNPDDSNGNEGPVVAHVSATEPAAEIEAPLEVGKSLETAVTENREALLVVLKGVPDPSAGDQPFKFELVRAIDRPLYMDVDAAEGPEQWISVAELQDADGNVLWTDRVNTLFQLMEFLQLVMEQQSSLMFSVSQVFSFVSMQYSSLLEFGVKIPIGIEGAKDYVIKVPKVGSDDLYEALRLDLDELKAGKVEPVLEGEAETIIENADPRDAIDIVILGDGYTADQREEFEGDAKVIGERLLKTSPFKEHKAVFNIHSVWTPANESGAGYDCTGVSVLDRDCKDELRDTPFETVFVLTALADRFQLDLQDTSDRVAMPLQVAKLYDAASAVPFDEIVMISNTNRTSGFAGLYVSIVTAYDPRIEFPDTAVHELGHSFGVLGDEYNIDGDPCLFAEPRISLPANIAASAEPDELKWMHWVEEDAPLPTPVGESVAVKVGAYAGAYNCDELFRPSYTCKMRDSDEDFCPVCSEQLVRRFHSVVDPIPEGGKFAVERAEGKLVFSAPLRDANLYDVEWKLGEESIGTGATLELEDAKLPETWTPLTGTVHESSERVRVSDPRLQQSTTWWIRR